ncbi:MAG: hypothetical protein DLM69_08385 [Candidatus Chloroheliales bacterium]|nr:MAG: hypothetical protein DLM69_08385 [Chloroflexota bacterium]
MTISRRIAGWLDFSGGSRVAAVLAALVAGLLIAAFGGVRGAGLVIGLLGAALLIVRPRLAFYLLVLSVPVQDVITVPLGVIDTTITQITFTGTIAAWLLWRLANNRQTTTVTPITFGFLVFLWCISASLLTTHSMPDSLAEIARWTVTFLVYILATNLIRTRKQMGILIGCLLAGGAFEAVLGVTQAFSLSGPLAFLANSGLLRAYGTIGAPNSYAGYIDHSLPLAVTLAIYWLGTWWQRQSVIIRAQQLAELRPPSFWDTQRRLMLRAGVLGMLLALAALLMLTAVILSESRGAWVGLTFGSLGMVVALGRRAVAPLIALGIIVLLGVAAYQANALPEALVQRAQSITDNVRIFDPHGLVPNPDNFSIIERMAQWYAAWGMFQSNPTLGVGIGNYTHVYDMFNVEGWPYSQGHAHNYYLNISAEAGLVGLFGYLVWLGTALREAARAVRRTRNNGYYQAIAIGSLGVLLTLMGHNFFENLHVLNMGVHLSSVLALFYLVRILPADEADEPSATAEAQRSAGWGFSEAELANTERG